MKIKAILFAGAMAMAVATGARAQVAAECRALANTAREAAKGRDVGTSAATLKAVASPKRTIDPEARAAVEQEQGWAIDFAFAHPTLYPDARRRRSTRPASRRLRKPATSRDRSMTVAGRAVLDEWRLISAVARYTRRAVRVYIYLAGNRVPIRVVSLAARYHRQGGIEKC